MGRREPKRRIPPYEVLQGDCRELIKQLPDNSIDAVCSDPPAGIAFMGKDWDDFSTREENPSGPQTEVWHANANPYARKATPRYNGKSADKTKGRDEFISFMTEVMGECLRVLKPGGHALIWAIPRTSHWTATAIEDAGFEIRDVITHHFGSGFPKSSNLGKQLDKAAGAKRQVVGQRPDAAKLNKTVQEAPSGWETSHRDPNLTLPATPLAAKWDGWGTALKPASEHWILARKPFKGSLVKNVMRGGLGALNIAGCRIDTADNLNGGAYSGGTREPVTGDDRSTVAAGMYGAEGRLDPEDYEQPLGRWPANLVFTHSEACELIGTKRVKPGNGSGKAGPGSNGFQTEYVNGEAKAEGFEGGHVEDDGTELVEDWACADDCPVGELDRQSGRTESRFRVEKNSGRKDESQYRIKPTPGTVKDFGDKGGASRFFYVAKAPRREKEAGLDALPIRAKDNVYGDGMNSATKVRTEEQEENGVDRGGAKNIHPTVKSVGLMRWLTRLITPPGGRVLDPFMGSGTTGMACLLEGFLFLGFEQEADYIEIAKARLAHVAAGGRL